MFEKNGFIEEVYTESPEAFSDAMISTVVSSTGVKKLVKKLDKKVLQSIFGIDDVNKINSMEPEVLETLLKKGLSGDEADLREAAMAVSVDVFSKASIDDKRQVVSKLLEGADLDKLLGTTPASKVSRTLADESVDMVIDSLFKEGASSRGYKLLKAQEGAGRSRSQLAQALNRVIDKSGLRDKDIIA